MLSNTSSKVLFPGISLVQHCIALRPCGGGTEVGLLIVVLVIGPLAIGALTSCRWQIPRGEVCHSPPSSQDPKQQPKDRDFEQEIPGAGFWKNST